MALAVPSHLWLGGVISPHRNRPWITELVQGVRACATFRSALASLVRRGRALAHKEAVLTAGMCRVGCAYNFCWYHDSLRLAAP
jgi:hypothetical protein